MPPLFDGLHKADDVIAQMPTEPIRAVAPAIVDGLANDPQYPLGLKLRENNVRGDNEEYAWIPRAPIQMFHCNGDKTVPPENAAVTLEILKRKGADVLLTEPENGIGADHSACILPSIAAAAAWFEAIR